jgi:hypothetical protein
MATAREELERFKFLVAHGRGDDKFHVVDILAEAKERIANKGPRPKTKFVLETDDPKLYSDFNLLKDRWFSEVNKSVALSVMRDLWDRPIEWIHEACEGKETHEGT